MADGDVPTLPRVTRVMLDAGLVDARWYTEFAAERGSAVHKACYLAAGGDLEESSLDPRIVGYVDAYNHFRSECNFRPQWREYEVASRVWRYVGHLDLAGFLLPRNSVDRLAVIDIKTGSAGPQTGVQLAAYGRALIEQRQLIGQPASRYALELRGDGTYKLIEYTDPADWSVFMAALIVTQWRKAHGQ